jgi:hypothetical protein
MPLPLYPMYWLNMKLGKPQSLSRCSSLATAVANNLRNVKCKIQEKPSDSEFPGNMSHNWQLCLMIHTSDTETPHWWLHTETKKWYRQQTTGSNILQSNWNGWGSGSTGHTCPGLKMIRSSKQMHAGSSWKLLTQSVSQPNHKFLKHLQ